MAVLSWPMVQVVAAVVQGLFVPCATAPATFTTSGYSATGTFNVPVEVTLPEAYRKPCDSSPITAMGGATKDSA